MLLLDAISERALKMLRLHHTLDFLKKVEETLTNTLIFNQRNKFTHFHADDSKLQKFY